MKQISNEQKNKKIIFLNRKFKILVIFENCQNLRKQKHQKYAMLY